ncbi:MAG: hypothetical protein ACRCUY_12415 [Thermoguttaceae bacterium]
MRDTLELFCPSSQNGRIFTGSSGLFLARVTRPDGHPLLMDEVESISYSIVQVGTSYCTKETPVIGHTNISLSAADVFISKLVTDANWPFDEIGYNFHHIPNDTHDFPFPVSGANYRIVYTLLPSISYPRLEIQYRIQTI